MSFGTALWCRKRAYQLAQQERMKDPHPKQMPALIAKYTWCQCDEEDPLNLFIPEDGHQIYNNDTYLCGNCGMVIQFG